VLQELKTSGATTFMQWVPRRSGPSFLGLEMTVVRLKKTGDQPATFPVLVNNRLTAVPSILARGTVEFESGKLPYKGHGRPESLLDIALNFGIHLEHACGGNCACTTCHVVVKDGLDGNLTEADDDELDRVDMAADLTPHSRLGCQAVVTGDVIVDIPAWNRNYISEGGASILGDAIPPPKKPQAGTGAGLNCEP